MERGQQQTRLQKTRDVIPQVDRPKKARTSRDGAPQSPRYMCVLCCRKAWACRRRSCIGTPCSLCHLGEGRRGPSLSVGGADHFSPGISIQRRRLPGTAHHTCCMSACPHCTHVRSQASGLIGLVRLQADPLACSKVDKHACLSPCRLTSLRNPKPSIDVQRSLRAVFASGCLTEGYGEGSKGIQRGYLTSRVDCVLACPRSPFGSLRAVRRNRTLTQNAWD